MLSWFEGDFGGQKLRDKANYRAANARAQAVAPDPFSGLPWAGNPTPSTIRPQVPHQEGRVLPSTSLRSPQRHRRSSRPRGPLYRRRLHAGQQHSHATHLFPYAVSVQFVPRLQAAYGGTTM